VYQWPWCRPQKRPLPTVSLLLHVHLLPWELVRLPSLPSNRSTHYNINVFVSLLLYYTVAKISFLCH
jgi:hypothetical protein